MGCGAKLAISFMAAIVFATPGKLGPAVIATIAADGSDRKVLTSPYWDSLGAEYTQDGNTLSSPASWTAWSQLSGSWTPTANNSGD